MPKQEMKAPMPSGGAKDVKKALGSLVAYCKKYLTVIVIAVCCAALSAVLAVIGPDYISELTAVIQKGISFTGVNIDMDEIARIGCILIAIYAGSMLLNYCQSFIMNYVSTNVGRKMRSDISKKINKIPLKYFDTHNYGDTLSVRYAIYDVLFGGNPYGYLCGIVLRNGAGICQAAKPRKTDWYVCTCKLSDLDTSLHGAFVAFTGSFFIPEK